MDAEPLSKLGLYPAGPLHRSFIAIQCPDSSVRHPVYVIAIRCECEQAGKGGEGGGVPSIPPECPPPPKVASIILLQLNRRKSSLTSLSSTGMWTLPGTDISTLRDPPWSYLAGFEWILGRQVKYWSVHWQSTAAVRCDYRRWLHLCSARS